MNLLEHYIEKVHSVREVHNEYDLKHAYCEVDVTYDCYGQKERKKRLFQKSEWEKAKRRGYFMA